ncbi:PREDICTED: linker for activation of T-cells family member 1 isoform X2 [Condylura cristata]|uniref:linker for activation of T-cells family member 1 isoform X2 n=1 Tax=Condylura cristata TaxID=143302 RepID=UPI00064323E5|nr:PREDICTED: linker for activation of T-cells family member 1 isoform X2 [Condylura cristata]
MEAATLLSHELGLLLLPLLAVLLMALCVRCRDLPGSYDSSASDSVTTGGLIKPSVPLAPWPPVSSYLPVTSYPPLSQPDLLPIPRSPQPSGSSHRMPPPRQDSDGEPVCEDKDDDEEDPHNEGYLVVLPDNIPATTTTVQPAPGPSNTGHRDSNFSMESGEDYVNVHESEESGDASLDGSREYVNVSQELQPAARTEPATRASQELEEEEEELPDYENLQELN